jgi:hypothetical protein|tara:strand:+ start:14970 stop:17117 length:2148 start_codon:yes stop_codon:yes gene_type:complete
MPSTVYKGDVSEVAFAPETGLDIIDNVDCQFALTNANGVTTIRFSAEANTTLFEENTSKLKYPKNALVGSQLTFKGIDDGKIFTIIENDGQTIKISPAVSSTIVTSNDVLSILPYKTPPMDTAGHTERNETFTVGSGSFDDDPTITHASSTAIAVGMIVTATGGSGSGAIPTGAYVASVTDATHFELSVSTTGGAKSSATLTFTKSDGATSTPSESLLIDQFLGIANAIVLPETKVDLKRYHVVGLGRDTSVQVPGKFTTEGGSFEVNLHSARWLKYCLGNELVGTIGTSGTATTLSAKAHAGQSLVNLAATANAGVGRYLLFKDTNNPVDHASAGDGSPTVDIVSDHAATQGEWDGTIDDRDFDQANGYEIRRIIGVAQTANTYVYLDQPLTFSHESGSDVQIFEYDNSALASTNAPAIASNGTITNPITHLIYSRSILPSFSIEVSQRRSDVDSSTIVDGSIADTKDLTRIFRGCKVSDFTLTTDNDAALRLSVNFNAALCFTDTGRLETANTSTSRYNPHRMFDDTANTAINRLKSGIGIGTQKPFMFYNGQIKVAGQTVAQVHNFSLTGQTGVQAFHTINNTSIATGSADSQVPFAGSRNASIMVEGQTSYEMTMEIVVDDPIFYHKMRSQTEFSVNSEGATTNQIIIEFEKQARGTTAADATEKLVVLIDEYYIVEAPMQIPEDKGVMKSTMKIMPKAIKVLSRDTILKY